MIREPLPAGEKANVAGCIAPEYRNLAALAQRGTRLRFVPPVQSLHSENGKGV